MSNAITQDQYFREIAKQTAITLGLERDYEHEQLEHFGKLLKDAKRFIDVGANHGLYARLANRVLRNGYIGMVEANPELSEMLRRDIPNWPSENNNKIEVFSVAAGDVSTTLPFFMDASDDLGKIALDSSTQAKKGRHVEVRCEPLDRLFASAERTLIKLDVEGFEYRAIFGAKRLLSADNTRMILELHGWGDGKKFPVHVVSLMFRLGFACRQIGNSYSFDCTGAGLLMRSAALVRVWPRLALKYLIRRMGLRPLVYRILWPDLVARAGK